MTGGGGGGSRLTYIQIGTSTARLRAAYNSVTCRAAASLRGDAPPDVERLARELQAATDQTLGRSGARFLLGTVMAF